MKVCKTCQLNKAYEEYYTHPSAKDGYVNICKGCTQLRRKASAEFKRINGTAAVRTKQEIEQINAKRKEYRLLNKEKLKASHREYKRRALEEDPEGVRLKQRAYHLQKKYGISIEQYEELLDKQNRCCALCGISEEQSRSKLAVDHDHHTLRIRGILCHYCNYRIVGRHRDPELLRKAANYIEQGTDWFAPANKKKRKNRG